MTLPPERSSTQHNEAWKSARKYMSTRLQTQPSTAQTGFDIPVIDLESSFSPSLAHRQHVAGQMRSACTSSGFFYITNHNISIPTCTSILQQAERIFKELSPDKKEDLHVRHSPYYHGWEPTNATSINGDAETKECYNWGYEERLDPTGGDGQYVHIDGSKGQGNLWPQEEDLPGFFDAVKEYYGQILCLARHLAKLFALSLHLPESYFDEMVTHPGGVARLIYYPPSAHRELTSSATAENDETIGLGAHSDYQCFTLLLSSSPGLEILSPDGKWITAPTVPDSLVVNIGDFFMRLTNDFYKSTIHRVINRSGQERYSVPFFFSVNYDSLIETLPSCVSEERPVKYAPVRAGEYISQRLAMTRKDGNGLH